MLIAETGRSHDELANSSAPISPIDNTNHGFLNDRDGLASVPVPRIATNEEPKMLLSLFRAALTAVCRVPATEFEGFDFLSIIADRVCAKTHECLIPGHQTAVYSFLDATR